MFTATGVGTAEVSPDVSGTAELFDNTGAAIPRTTFGRCRWIVSEDSTIGSGEVVKVNASTGAIEEVELHHGGSGFEESPYVQITSDSIVTAGSFDTNIEYTIVSLGSIDITPLTNAGTGYILVSGAAATISALTSAGTGYTLVGAVDTISILTQTGTGYTTGTKSTTVSPAGGTGLTVDVVATDGKVDSVSINADGSGYSVGDVITISTGGANATFTVTKTDLTNVPTTVSPAGGTGLTVDVVVTNGIVNDVIVNQIGSGYSVGDVITITTGNSNATFIIKSISTDFTLIGASANTVGVTFTATGAGTGIGTARRVGQGANFTPFGSKIGGILKAIAVTPGVNYGKNTTVSSQEKTTPWTTAKGIARTDIVIDFDGK